MKKLFEFKRLEEYIKLGIVDVKGYRMAICILEWQINLSKIVASLLFLCIWFFKGFESLVMTFIIYIIITSLFRIFRDIKINYLNKKNNS